MALSAIVDQGKITNAAGVEKKANEASSSLGKDDFLQLLVAQMKYQDPMEPTSNTEYIQQYATYSELEQMMNMSETMDLQRASGLVGQMVCVEFTTEAGIDKVVEGIVDYVYYESGTPFVSINGELYKAEDVTNVYDATYIEATELASAWIKEYESLPRLEDITLGDYEKVAALYTSLEQFSDYTKGFISDEMEAELKTYVEKVVALKKDETNSNTTENVQGTDNTEATE
jgi:flagellar basal-body rod modification protein FlgD